MCQGSIVEDPLITVGNEGAVVDRGRCVSMRINYFNFACVSARDLGILPSNLKWKAPARARLSLLSCPEIQYNGEDSITLGDHISL